MVKSVDYVLVERSQAGDNDARYCLFKRFERLIFKNSHYSRQVSTEDFFQDAFESLAKCIDYVKLDRIRNPESFGFRLIFQNYLFKQVSKLNKNANRELCLTSLEGCLVDDEENGSQDLLDSLLLLNQQESCSFGSQTSIDSYRIDDRLESGYVGFVESLSTSHVEVLEAYQDTHTMSATARKLNRDNASVIQDVKFLKKRALQHFKIAEFA